MTTLVLCQSENVIVTMLGSAPSPYHVEAANTAERLKSNGKASQVKLILLFY